MMTPASDNLLLPDDGSGDMSQSMTDWSMVFRAADVGPQDDVEVWDRVMRRYWPAIFAYVRRTGLDVNEASDLTQGFVCDVIIGRQLLSSADPNRGRFRTLLMSSLRNYLIEQHRKATRKKRAPDARPPITVNIAEVRSKDLIDERTPEQAFSEQWTASIVRAVLEKLRLDCEDDSLGLHWRVFEGRVVQPLLQNIPPVPYRALVESLSLVDTAQAQNMMITVKRRFANLLHSAVSDTVDDPAEIDDELLALLRPEERPNA